MAKKSCKKGYYYCNTDEKCKKIPKGYHVMPTGYLMKDSTHKEDEKEETKKKNGNGTNGNGNGDGDSSGSSDGGGVSEGWSAKYKRSIDCDNPKGFSQRAHCQGRKKVTEGKEGDHEISMAKGQVKSSIRNLKKIEKVLSTMSDKDNLPAWLQAKITDTEHNTDAAAGYMDDGEEDLDEAKKCWKGYKKAGTQKLFGKTYNRCVKAGYEAEGEQLDEKRDGKSAKDKDYSLRDWFKGGGWVQTGGKYDGKPCAKQPGQKTKPFCRDADDRASMSKKERNRRAAKKRKEDPNPNRKGKAKMVTASYSNWRSELEQLDEFLGGKPGDGYIGHPNLDIKNPFAKKQIKKEVLPNSRGGGLIQRSAAGIGDARMRQNTEIRRLLGQSYEPEGEVVSEGKPYKVGDTIPVSATKPQPRKTKFNVDKTGLEGPENPLQEGKKDACYHKVKSRYKVWPSAYASGALVKCRKVGAKNWGNKKEGFSDWRTEMIMEGKLEDRLSKMSDDEFRQFIKGRTGPEAETFRQKRASARASARASSQPQRPGAQMPPDFAKQGVSSKPRTVNVGDYANRNVPGSAWQRAQQNPSSYRPGPGVKPDFSGVNPTPRPRPNVRVRGGGKFGLIKALAGPALVAGASVLANVIANQQNKNSRAPKNESFDNWKDNYTPTEIESVDIIKAEPLRASDWRTELNIIEDWQKSNRKDGVDGMSQKSVNAYKRENPGSKLQTAVTEKKPKGKRAKRRKSFCARSKGQKDMHNIDCSKTPEKKICKARKRWRC
jgi:hypothetical protein